jgi:hypothetical protein
MCQMFDVFIERKYCFDFKFCVHFSRCDSIEAIFGHQLIHGFNDWIETIATDSVVDTALSEDDNDLEIGV